MVDFYKDILYSIKNEWGIATGNNLDQSHENKVERKKPERRECTLNDSTYTEFTNSQSEPEALEVRAVVVCGWRAVTRRHEGVPGVLVRSLFIDLGAAYLGVFILWKLFELYTNNLFTFLCICYTSTKIQNLKNTMKTGSQHVFFLIHPPPEYISS